MKKLIVLLVVLALSMPAMAAYIGVGNPLKVDIVLDQDCPASGWQAWGNSWNWTGPISKQFSNPFAMQPWEVPTGQLDIYSKNFSPVNGNGYSRNRSGGITGILGTGEYGPGSQRGLGMAYVKLTLTGLEPEVSHKIYLWAAEADGVWNVNTNNPDSKYIAWCTTNPKAWLDARVGSYTGMSADPDPNGYGAIDEGQRPTSDSNMPGSANNPYSGTDTSLYDLVMGCGAEGGRASLKQGETGYNGVGQRENYVEFYAMTDADGALVVYGWMDTSDYSGSMHIPFMGFEVVPEPATIALLGLGGLALIRRRKRA